MPLKPLDDKIKAILFDLDGTLIDVNLKLFIPGYLKLLSKTVDHLIPSNKFVLAIMKSSDVIDKHSGPETNEEIFHKTFFPSVGYSREEIEPYFDKFYENDFKQLQQYTKKKPEARPVVQAVFDKDYAVAIATTPLLPLNAIKQRLDWAGVGDFPYNLITSIEFSCATKPNPLYYQQIFDFLSYPAEACLMVGDEAKDLAASKLGCQTFLVESENTKIEPDTPEPTYQGTLKDLELII
jgi:HAD superfamily hydrolase (TIGR01549 family)